MKQETQPPSIYYRAGEIDDEIKELFRMFSADPLVQGHISARIKFILNELKYIIDLLDNELKYAIENTIRHLGFASADDFISNQDVHEYEIIKKYFDYSAAILDRSNGIVERLLEDIHSEHNNFLDYIKEINSVLNGLESFRTNDYARFRAIHELVNHDHSDHKHHDESDDNYSIPSPVSVASNHSMESDSKEDNFSDLPPPYPLRRDPSIGELSSDYDDNSTTLQIQIPPTGRSIIIPTNLSPVTPSQLAPLPDDHKEIYNWQSDNFTNPLEPLPHPSSGSPSPLISELGLNEESQFFY